MAAEADRTDADRTDADRLARLVGAAARRRREEIRLSQAEAAAAAGLSRGHYCDVENGHKLPGILTLYLIAAALDCPIGELLPPHWPPPQ